MSEPEATEQSTWYVTASVCYVIGFLSGVVLCQWGGLGLLVFILGVSLLMDGLCLVARRIRN